MYILNVDVYLMNFFWNYLFESFFGCVAY